ncbi:MAG: recombinase family protein [bacterium]|nr:recombinase family protein [bacterium]
MSDKIREDHLQRAAYIYVRQSSLHQVRHHRESRQRQYDLTYQARQLGFAKTVVIDEDQGKSGSGLQHRPGFGRLLSAVCQGEVGAVLALEASRLARNNRDWYHLIDLCALTETLIIDTDGVYEPRELNDRLLLGLKGSMAEFELGLLRQRAREAFEQKVRRGHAMWEMPVGLVRNEEDRIEKIPDRQVQEAIGGVFRKFRELGSGRQALLWYRDEQIPLPEVRPATRGREVVWRLPTAHRIYQMLKNPHYAGALAYGRTTETTVVQDGRARKTGSRQRKPRDQWKVLLLDNHPGYITWDEYLENQRILESNLARQEGTTRGAAKRGPALLAGLLRCGRCGRRLYVAYSGTGGRVPRYACNGGRTDRGHATCLSLGGVSIERGVVDQVLEAIQPAGIEAALTALEHQSEARLEKRRSLELALEKARYEVRRARRQYDAVDPDNRLVAGELEVRWNDALSSVSRIEEELAVVDASCSELTQEAKERLLQLGSDLPALWRHPSASNELKKRILRTVLHEIVIDNDEDQRRHILQLHWQGGVHTELRVRFNGTGQRRVRTKKTAIELIRELSKVCSDQAIAATLNRLGFRTGGGKTWRVHSVQHTRYYYRLRNFRNSSEWLTVEQASKQLGVSHTVIRRLIREGTLPATQVVETTPWVINRKKLALPAVQSEVQAARQGRQLRRSHPNQAEIAFK